MALEQSLKPNGLKIRSWGDIAAIVTILAPTLAMLIAVVFWGLKVEDEVNAERLRTDSIFKELWQISERDFRLQARIDKGILPRAEERIRALEKRLDTHEKNHK